MRAGDDNLLLIPWYRPTALLQIHDSDANQSLTAEAELGLLVFILMDERRVPTLSLPAVVSKTASNTIA